MNNSSQENAFRYGYKLGLIEYHRQNNLSELARIYTGLARRAFDTGYRSGQAGEFGQTEREMQARRETLLRVVNPETLDLWKKLASCTTKSANEYLIRTGATTEERIQEVIDTTCDEIMQNSLNA